MKFLLPALTVLLSSTNAFAAGYDWSGAYLGGQMGYASGTSAIAAISMSSSSSARMDSWAASTAATTISSATTWCWAWMRISALRISRTMASTTTVASAIPKWERRSRCAGMARPGSAQAMPSIGSCRTSRRVFLWEIQAVGLG